MGFKLNRLEDLAALKSTENVYKKESHTHQYAIPSETAVWNEENLPPSRRVQGRNATAGDQTATSQEQNPTSSGSQTANQSNMNTEQTPPAPLPQRERRTEAAVCLLNDSLQTASLPSSSWRRGAPSPERGRPAGSPPPTLRS